MKASFKFITSSQQFLGQFTLSFTFLGITRRFEFIVDWEKLTPQQWSSLESVDRSIVRVHEVNQVLQAKLRREDGVSYAIRLNVVVEFLLQFLAFGEHVDTPFRISRGIQDRSLLVWDAMKVVH